ncbi:MAG: radical SAM protein [Deltaproteobacteria bacterium]|nr:radical SAM protein [Deltaproteobacteria bacterium]
MVRLSMTPENAFQFALDTSPESGSGNLKDMFRAQLLELLKLLVPTRDGEEVLIDGFKILNDPNTVWPLYVTEDPDCSLSEPLDLYEPRIRYIRRTMEALLRVVDLETNGEPVSVDGFRLKDLKQWLAPGNASDILAHAAGRCNLDCRFCYNKGASRVLNPVVRGPEDEYREIRTRIEQYRPQAGLGVFPDMGSPAELLIHPRILDILTELRQKTGETLRFSTNGSTLTQETIQNLAGYKPIYLDVSLNSSSPERRAWLMRDPCPRTAIDSLAILREAGIPYAVVIVPWPEPDIETMLEDLEQTIPFAADFDPGLIQISLPGYSRGLSEDTLFSHGRVWDDIKKKALSLRAGTDVPVVLRPGLFEEYTDPGQVNAPVLIGTIKNSPLARAGIRAGDRLLRVNGLKVMSRPQARSLLTVLHDSDLKSSSITVEREGGRIERKTDLTDFGYPYTRETATHLGAAFASSGVPSEWLERLRDTVLSRKAEEALLLTSSLVKPTLESLMAGHGFRTNGRLHIRIPRNSYFGGNISMGDLLVVQDFIEAIEEFIEQEHIRPDLVIIPSSPFHLSGWGRDLTGRVYLDIERRTGCPVALVECDPIFD